MTTKPPISIGWPKIGERMECSAETARARWRRGDITVRKPKGWNKVVAINDDLDAELLEIARKAPVHHPKPKTGAD